MTSGPTMLAVETDSAWVVILVTSLVTLCAVLLFRRVIGRPGGFVSAILLTLPLVLPLLAAVVYQNAVLPEVAVLRPAAPTLLKGPGDLLHLVPLPYDRPNSIVPYVLWGSAGRWLVLVALSVSSFMVLRRLSGHLLVRRLMKRCRPLDASIDPRLTERVKALSETAGLKQPPAVLLLPKGMVGAFATAGRQRKILISEELLEALEDKELDAIVAHEIAHLQARDVEVVLVAGFLRDLVAWNPIAHLAFRRLAGDRELEADRRSAALTGDPLAVASGLLKTWDLMRRRGACRHSVALGFLRAPAGMARRVSHLLAVADGRASVKPVGFAPYVMAGLVAAALGLEVAAQVARQNDSALAIVWGSPTATDTGVWPGDAPATNRARAEADRKAMSSDDARSKRVAGRGRRHRRLDASFAIREKDYSKWIKSMTRWAKREGGHGVKLRWEARTHWTAEPVFSTPTVGPVGVYRIELDS